MNSLMALIPRRHIITALFASLAFVASFWYATETRAYNNFNNPACQWSYAGGSSLLNVYWRENPSYPPPGDYYSAFSEGRSDWYNTNTPLVFPWSPSGVASTARRT